MIYVFGHKTPDTDSIVSSMVYTQFLASKWLEVKNIKLWEINNETKFILDKAWVQAPETVMNLEVGSKVFLLDHNENSQTIDNIAELELVGIVDHHKIGSLSTKDPIEVRFEKLGSSASLVYKIMKENEATPTKTQALLLLSAIISDTLFFRSPTTTEDDKVYVQELNKIAEISNLEAYSLEMFNAKSDLWDIAVEDLIKLDYKEFDFSGVKAWVGTIETTNPWYTLGRKEEVIAWMKKIKTESGLDFILLSVVDILNETNTTFVVGELEEKAVQEVFGAATTDNLADLGNRLSRKKQIVPQLTEYFEKK